MESIQNTTSVVVRPLFSPLIPQATLLLIISVLSLPFFGLLLYYLLTKPNLYHSLPNHVIILLLISNGLQTLLDIPAELAYYYTGYMQPATVAYCVYFYFVDYTLFTTCFLLLTWASFERHVFIFHQHFFNAPAKRWLVHYLPLGFCCVYPVIYYIVFLIFYPCEKTYAESIARCPLACYLIESAALAMYEQICHGYALIFLTFVFNLALFVRVLRQKRRAGQELNRGKSWKLMVQLLGICCLLLATNGGYFLIQLVRLLWDENFGRGVAWWIFPISLWMPPAVAFVCFATLKDVRQMMMALVMPRCRHRIIPLVTKRTQTNTSRT